MERLVEEQGEEIGELEGRIGRQEEVLRGLGRRGGVVVERFGG